MTTLPLPTSTTAKMIPPYMTTTTTATSPAKDSTTAPTRTSSAYSTTLATTISTAATAVDYTTLTSTSTLIMNTAATPTIEAIRTPVTIPSSASAFSPRSITTTIPYVATATRASTPIKSITTATSPATISTTATSTATSFEATAAISTPNAAMASTTSAAVTTTATNSSTTTSRNGRIMITSTVSTAKTATTASAATIPFSIRASTLMTSAATSLPFVNTTTTSLNATAGTTATTSAGTVNTNATQLKTARTPINESSSIGSIAESTMSITMSFGSGKARIRLRQNKTNSRKFKEYFRAQRNRILERAKLKLLVISSIMTIGLLVQLALITLLRKRLRQWTENKCGVQSRFLEDMEGRNWKVLPGGIKKTKMKQKRSNVRLEQQYNELTKQRKKNHHSLEDIVKVNRSGGTLQKSSLKKGDMGKVFDKELCAEQSSDEINIGATQSLESKSDSKEGQVKQRNIKESTSLGFKEEFAKPKESSESKSFDSKEEPAKPSSSKEGTTKPAD